MDEQVLAAMKRWPDVPDVMGWLRLDRRGQWLLIDRNVPGFDETRDGRGSSITNEQINAFIGRNYETTGDGRWYWQNGPQRAFVELDLAPWIGRVVERSDGDRGLVTHTGLACEQIDGWFVDDEGVLYAGTEHGPCAIHDLDLGSLDIELNESTDPASAGSAGLGHIVWNGRTLPLQPAQALLTKVVRSPLAASRDA